jgi:hypothetical protein
MLSLLLALLPVPRLPSSGMSIEDLSNLMQIKMAPNSLPQYRCQYIEGVEKVEGYRIGGFCPIAIGQMLDDKYEVIAKLGHGGYSLFGWLKTCL